MASYNEMRDAFMSLPKDEREELYSIALIMVERMKAKYPERAKTVRGPWMVCLMQLDEVRASRDNVYAAGGIEAWLSDNQPTR
jgi:hypothetical protein